ncbi:CRISPR-associated endonuclease/helicase Cas3 [Ruminococcus sp. YE71]|uniref:CRISPR-associated helicase/endonuclease Cas3 n=1 Tax=unclassified Ruminococcus TaxID=2608920 RepID=UPI000889130F|nr:MULTISPECIES: CRISPR-associated helicase/endonuclease Cas3 [unclassified Ruminococcus]SDA33200.1 CRISPR-associated endonuclease/helicase Cas3 [Ruminococcus sp. YE78]SFW54544.1 CRISPR-associated endonuclease/helicase Cas3 [Ruminococcus sp. YE71]
MFTAHISADGTRRQSVFEHSMNTARLAEGYLEAVGLSSSGKLAGLLHDGGKLTRRFDDYINGISDARRGEIDHSYTGAKYLFEEILTDKGGKNKAPATLIAHTIISHHALHDWIDEHDDDYFIKRISKTDCYKEASANIKEMLLETDLYKLFEKASDEIWIIIGKLKTADKNEMAFYIGMLERLIESALIDADRTDTADFTSSRNTAFASDNSSLWTEMNERMESKMNSFESIQNSLPPREKSISERRRSISDRCADFAGHKAGACRLIVPTGGGKTLSSLRFAIKQCQKFGMDRIFYVAPFMSILEQNSDIIRSIAGDENFLEHHSNILAEIDDENEYNEYQLHTERWDKPVIATTMVQFLNSLFSGKSSSVRRMHRLCNSVIIIDEVQSVPIKCVYLFTLAVNFLTKACGCAVVLCSATQPTFEKNKHKLILDEKQDMIPDYQSDFDFFKRTELINAVIKHGFDNNEAAQFCYERFKENGDLLFVVNTKSEALRFYELLKEKAENEAYIIHLSTNMCPAHRKKRIGTLRRFLKKHKPVICVTTQLIEAGVDISFRCVVRTLAGMDNAAQAAGRCNRNGEYERLCPVYLIDLKGENLGNLSGIKNAQDISRQILLYNSDDLLSAKVQSAYFEGLYKDSGEKMAYIPGKNKTSLLELLSLNKEKYSACGKPEPDKYMAQSFKTAGSLFEVIDSRTRNVIVPYNKKAKDIIAKLNSDISPEDLKDLLRKAQKYSVSIYSGMERKLGDSGAVYTISSLNCEITVLRDEFYSSEYGVTAEGSERELLVF